LAAVLAVLPARAEDTMTTAMAADSAAQEPPKTSAPGERKSARNVPSDTQAMQPQTAEEWLPLVHASLAGIKQRTKTRQISGGDNLNVMEWTTDEGDAPDMHGLLVYFKQFDSAFSFMNKRLGKFVEDPPDEWEDYGDYEGIAREFANDDIAVANQLIIDLVNWFRPKQDLIGDQGGVIIVFGQDGGAGALFAYADPSPYKDNNVSGLLTGHEYIAKVRVDDDVFVLPQGADGFFRTIAEEQGGLIGIEVPYVLHPVP
jgi:hypothetical protein